MSLQRIENIDSAPGNGTPAGRPAAGREKRLDVARFGAESLEKA
jgi:hypothetical protein